MTLKYKFLFLFLFIGVDVLLALEGFLFITIIYSILAVLLSGDLLKSVLEETW